MKKINLAAIWLTFCSIILVSCGGNETIKPVPTPAPPTASKPATPPTSTAQTGAETIPLPSSTGAACKPGGYYLDDGPGDNPPKDIDSIPNATPRKEPYLLRANKPYKALGTLYTPSTSYQPYKARGVASWYGKRYHGKNTSSGEVYDMFSMTAAHPTLPLPSYLKVTNPKNGRSVIVRVNDRGPFKNNRLVDLSYAAAYKLRYSNQGSELVEVEAIDPDNIANFAVAPLPANTSTNTSTNAPTSTPTTANNSTVPAAKPVNCPPTSVVSAGYYVQVGAFKNEANANALIKKIQGLNIAQNGAINSVYNKDLYRIKLGPYDNKQTADQVAANIRKELSVSTIIINQP
jgi:rare lipoprotein A